METVELYLADDATTEVLRPLEGLKGFQKVSRQPGETKRVEFTIVPADLSYYDAHLDTWVSTPGAHRVLVGTSSRDVRLHRTFRVQPRT